MRSAFRCDDLMRSGSARGVGVEVSVWRRPCENVPDRRDNASLKEVNGICCSAVHDVQREYHAVSRLCRCLAVSRSGYYRWCNAEPNRYVEANRRLCEQVEQIHYANHQAYGTRRIKMVLQQQGHRSPRGHRCRPRPVPPRRRRPGAPVRDRRRLRALCRPPPPSGRRAGAGRRQAVPPASGRASVDGHDTDVAAHATAPPRGDHPRTAGATRGRSLSSHGSGGLSRPAKSGQAHRNISRA